MAPLTLTDGVPTDLPSLVVGEGAQKKLHNKRRVSAALSSSLSSRKSDPDMAAADKLEAERLDRTGEGWETIKRLQEGFCAFREKVNKNVCPSEFQQLKFHQEPKVMVIACVDSRVSPNMVLQAHPGDIFTHRNVANLVPPYERQGAYHGTSTCIEYAVCHLK
eukprot:1186616-Prorocentrum_minimum.AAC.3